MITRTMIIEELNNRGYVAEEATTIKNGIPKEGIMVKKDYTDRVAPNLCSEDFITRAENENLSVYDIVDEIEEIIRRCNNGFDVSSLSDKEYILSHIRLGLQATGTECIMKRPSCFEGLEEYLFIEEKSEKGHLTLKLRKELLQMADVAYNIAWSTAEKNSYKETTIQSLSSIVSDMMGVVFVTNEEAPIYVISNKSNYRGASNITDRKAIKKLADNIGIHEFIVIPSSIHECIIAPKPSEMEMEEFNNLVKEVNSTVLSPEDKLIDKVYTITV